MTNSQPLSLSISLSLALAGVTALAAQQPRLVRDISPNGSASPRSVTEIAGSLVFSANDGTTGFEPWISDGTTAGTRRLGDLRPGRFGSNPTGFMMAGGKLFFEADDGVAGRELWVWQPGGSPSLVRDLRPGAQGSGPGPIASIGGELVFVAEVPGVGRELHVTDGTAAGTRLLRDIAPGAPSVQIYGWELLGDRLIFSVGLCPNCDKQVWVTDGTAAGTRMLKREASNKFARLGRFVYFSGYEPRTGFELWRTDGTIAGTTLVRDLNAGSYSSLPVSFAAVGNRLFFAARTNATGYEYFVSDGTPAGTRLLLDIAPGREHGSGWMAGAAGDLCFFTARPSPLRLELWRSDGTPNGTFPLLDIFRRGGRISRSVRMADRRIYFTTGDDALWTSDGTVAGTRQLGALSRADAYFVLADGNIYTVINDPVVGAELFALDLPASTQRVGSGCRTGGLAPQLVATTPRVGLRMDLAVDEAAPNTGGVILVGVRAAWPLHIGGGCTIHVDFRLPNEPLSIRTDAAGRFRQALRVPANASLVGARLVLQGAVGPTATAPLGLDLTPAALVKIGR